MTRCAAGASRSTATASGGRPSPATSGRWPWISARSGPGRSCGELVAHCDVVLENFRPGTLERWGLDYAALAAVQPQVVLVHISGFGQTGTAGRPGRVRERGRGDGRDPPHHRQPRPSPPSRRHQPRRRPRLGVRRDRHALRPAVGARARRRPGGRRGDLRSGRRADGVDDGRLRARRCRPHPHREHPPRRRTVERLPDLRRRRGGGGRQRRRRVRPPLQGDGPARARHRRPLRHPRGPRRRTRPSSTTSSARGPPRSPATRRWPCSTSTACPPGGSSPRPTCSATPSTSPARWCSGSPPPRAGTSR